MSTRRATVPPPSRAYVVSQLAGWSAYACVGWLVTGLFTHLGLRLGLTTAFGCALGLAGTHVLRREAYARAWWDRPLARLVPRLLAGAAAAAVAVELGVWAFGLFVTRVYTLATSTPAVMTATTINWLFTMVLWVAVYSGVQFFRRFRLAEIRRLQLEVAARDAQLQALQAQVHPHFLFNSLNSLRALIPEDPARARDLVTGLAELMRYALQAGRRERVTLAEELEIVEGYLRLEEARFEDRLRWSVAVPEPLRSATLPPMALQSLVENAVKHGISRSDAGGTIGVEALREDGRLRLRVTNPGRVGPAREGAIGLANVSRRLALGWGEAATVTLSEDAPGLVSAEIVLPLEDDPR